MTHLAILLFENNPPGNDFGHWLFLSIGAVSLFVVFLPLVLWIDSRRKEREAFYKSETLRRLAEASGESAKAAIELLREGNRLERIKKREGIKIGGMINLGVGVALVVFLRIMLGGGQGSPYLCGLIPGLIGVAMLIYVYFLAAPVE